MNRDQHHEQVAAPAERAGPVMRYIVEHLVDHPAVVFSRRGEVLLQTRPAAALLGGHTWLGGSSCCRYLYEVSVSDHHRLRRYRHAELGELELRRQLLVDWQEHQILMVFTAASGSPSEKKLRLLAATTD